MPEIISKSAYAARHGVRANTLSSWISRGHLTSGALTADGRIVVDEADRQLGERLDQSRSIGKSAANAAVAPEQKRETFAPPPLGSLADIKRRQAELDLRRGIEQEQERRGRYVLADGIRREHMREIVQFLATVEQRVPELVAAIAGLNGKAAVTAARRWWRSLRQDEAASARARAETAPEFDLDQPEGWPAREMEEARAP